jgi:c-di-GMP-binding flagellar brake protein YcgR
MNRRRQYRVTADFEKYVQLELLGPKVHATRVRLLDLSSGGCGVELPRSADGLLRRRDYVDLRVISERLPEPLDMRGQVAWLKDAARAPQVGLIFVDWRQHRVLMDSDLKGLFNEREAFRVSPDTRNPVTVELHLEDGANSAIQGNVRDISVLGLGVSVPTDQLALHPALEMVRASFVLPGTSERIQAAAEVRYVRADLEKKSAHVGLRLAHPERIPAPVRRTIQQYIMGRQRDLCRMGVREVA